MRATEKAPARHGVTEPGKNQEQRQAATTSVHFQAETLAALRSRLPDYLAARGVELRRNGTRLIGRCPMHDDSSPSLAVYGINHGFCGCYPCGFSGDVFAVSQWLGHASTFPDAVQDVARTLGVFVPEPPFGGVKSPATPRHPSTKTTTRSYILSDEQRAEIHQARMAFTEAFWDGDEIIDRIAASLGFNRETLRHAAWGNSGLGLASGWLCYAYPSGLKWRNPDPAGNPRFLWIVGKALAPWRMEWAARPEVATVILTEGESDCLAFIDAGLEVNGNTACVASPGTSFPQEWAPLFSDKHVILSFDADTPGNAATHRVATLLRPYAASIKTLDLSD